MVDGKKLFINWITGEVILRRSRLSAYLYFKRDGKRCGYPTMWAAVQRVHKGFVKTTDGKFRYVEDQTENKNKVLTNLFESDIIRV